MAEDDIPQSSIPGIEEDSSPLLGFETDTEKAPLPRDIKIPPLPHSSVAPPRPDRAPRTPNRVRFQFDDGRPSAEQQHSDSHENGWIDGDDYMNSLRGTPNGRPSLSGPRRPLLTDIESPIITLATADDPLDLEDYLESARPKSGMRSAFMNMANSIIGAGIIGQPYAFRQAGLLAGILLLVALTGTVDWTIRLIVINSKLSGANSFQATVEHCFGKPGLIAISLAQWAFAFGGMIAFCIIVGDTIPHVFSALMPHLTNTLPLSLLANRQVVIILLILGVSFPLSLFRDIAKLVKASALALLSMTVILVAVITQGFRVPSESRGAFKGSLLVNNSIFQAIGVISFAFVCHHNSLLIYGSLKKPTLDRFARVTHWSTGISMIACLVMALAGYVTFGDKTAGNVLNNFPSDNTVVNIARLCFGLNMLTTLPLEAFVCREVILNYFYPDEAWERKRHIIITSSLVVAAVLISLILTDLGFLLELIGATSACMLAYILPPLCYIKLSTPSWKTAMAVACIAFGTVVFAISVLQALGTMIT